MPETTFITLILPGKRVGNRAENKSGKRFVVGIIAQSCARVSSASLKPYSDLVRGGIWRKFDNVVEQNRKDRRAFRCRNGINGTKFAFGDGFGEIRDNVFFVKRAVFKVFFQSARRPIRQLVR
ncbi:MAG: hypothetical protein WKF73_16395 [Nocardioidaceae bacterium]